MYRAERRLCREIKKKFCLKMFSSLTGVFIKQPSYIYIYIILNYFLENFLYIFAPYSLPFLRFPNRYPDHFPFHIPHKKEQSRYVSINRLSTNLRSVYGLILHSPTTRPFLPITFGLECAILTRNSRPHPRSGHCLRQFIASYDWLKLSNKQDPYSHQPSWLHISDSSSPVWSRMTYTCQ